MNSKTHLPNLDGLRFIMASLVLFGHVHQAILHNEGVSTPDLPIYGFGALAVVFFFVLSGFLITYLLLQEKERGGIKVRHFYLKRVARIWPVYFLVVILSFAFFNNSPFFQWKGVTNNIFFGNYLYLSIFLLLVISPNVLMLITGGLGYATPAWSIGIEEQFYLVWPWIIRSRHALYLIVLLIAVVYLLSSGILLYALEKLHLPPRSNIYRIIYQVSRFFTFQFSFRIDSMAIGALGAFLVHKKTAALSIVFEKKFQLLLYAVFFTVFLFPTVASYQFCSVIFSLIIMNLAMNPDSILRLEGRLLSYGGRISYGIYMYHCFLIIPSIVFVKFLGMKIGWLTEMLICVVTLSAVYLIAALSFRFFERFFLDLGKRK